MFSLLLIALALGQTARFRFFVPEDATITEASPSAPAAFAAAAAGDGFGVKMVLEINRAGQGWRQVPLGTPICHADLVALTFTPSEAGYATVINQGTDGETVLLFPYYDRDDNRIRPDKPARFPATGGFTVDATPGTEGIMVFVSPSPLSWEAQTAWEYMLGRVAPEDSLSASQTGVTTREVTIQHLRNLGPAQETYVVGDDELHLAFTMSHVEPCPAL